MRRQKADAEIARAYQVHPLTLSKWKKEFWEKGAEVFGGRDEVRSSEQKISKLERMLGQKEVESWHYRHNGYGRPRTTAELRERLDYRINSKRVERLLRDPLLIKKAIDITLRKGWAEIRPSHLIFSIVCMRCIAKINDTRSRLQGSAEGTTGITLLPVTCSHKWYLPTLDGRQNPSPF